MAYRDDRDALKDRISFLEGQLERQVSPAELDVLRSEVLELKGRLLNEQQRLESISAKLAIPSVEPTKKETSLAPLFTAMALLATAGVVVGLLLTTRSREPMADPPAQAEAQSTLDILPVEVVRSPQSHPHFENIDPFSDREVPTPDSVRAAIETLRPSLQGCAGPQLFRGTFEITFDHSGVPSDVRLSEGSGSEQAECLLSHLQRMRVEPFSRLTATVLVPIVLTSTD